MAEKSVIVNLEDRIGKLLADHARLVTLCAELSTQCDTLKVENRGLQEQIKDLHNQLSCTQLAEGLAGDSRNKAKAKARVNRLMREVDKCIALLGKQDAANRAQ
ncbi:MAG: hypothetical protein RSB23_06435 [Alistipes sp.]